MMPEWNSAPEWAQYVAKDASGSWWWYESEPSICGNMWLTPGGIRSEMCDIGIKWVESLQSRPITFQVDWEIAPTWANHLVYQCGMWMWYEKQADPTEGVLHETYYGLSQRATNIDITASPITLHRPIGE
jgi:hypothetical protein